MIIIMQKNNNDIIREIIKEHPKFKWQEEKISGFLNTLKNWENIEEIDENFKNKLKNKLEVTSYAQLKNAQNKKVNIAKEWWFSFRKSSESIFVRPKLDIIKIISPLFVWAFASFGFFTYFGWNLFINEDWWNISEYPLDWESQIYSAKMVGMQSEESLWLEPSPIVASSMMMSVDEDISTQDSSAMVTEQEVIATVQTARFSVPESINIDPEEVVQDDVTDESMAANRRAILPQSETSAVQTDEGNNPAEVGTFQKQNSSLDIMTSLSIDEDSIAESRVTSKMSFDTEANIQPNIEQILTEQALMKDDSEQEIMNTEIIEEILEVFWEEQIADLVAEWVDLQESASTSSMMMSLDDPYYSENSDDESWFEEWSMWGQAIDHETELEELFLEFCEQKEGNIKDEVCHYKQFSCSFELFKETECQEKIEE